MSIDLITEKHGLEIMSILSQSQENILIISPFLGRKTCEELSKVIISNGLKCKIITRFYREDFLQGANSLDGLLSLLDSGAEIRALIHLHTKLYVFDDNYSIITSANYTYGGLYSNIELGIKFENEKNVIQKCTNYFQELWGRIEDYNQTHDNKATITEQMILEEKKIVNKLISERTSSTVNKNISKQGADITEINNENWNNNFIEQALITNSLIDINDICGGWLKFAADAKHRFDPNNEYFVNENDFTKKRTFFPTSPRSIKSTDQIFMSLISYDNDNIPTPIIVGRGYSKGYDEKNVISGKFKGWEEFMTNYRYYIEFTDLEIMKGPVKNGISLLDVYRQLRGRTYPSSFEQDVPFEKIRTYHHQKDKIQITKVAEEYINNELDKRFAKFGVTHV
ncbi:MAG: hypothetical protein Ta2F_18100 [Termitinemataceae bacterium]|nr:MAG: hypothetical protein Ta2F_18100 [Termitinemataceae bacterium]